MAAALYAWKVSSSAERSANEPGEMAVLVARHYLPAFTVVKSEDAILKTYPEEAVPPGALRSVKELAGDKDRPVFTAAVSIPEGQPLTRTILQELGKDHAMASLLAPGKTAVSFAVDEVRGVGGWVEPGDVIAIFQTARERSLSAVRAKSTGLLFSTVSVLAVDKKRLGQPPAPAPALEPGMIAAAEAMQNSEHVITVLLNPVEAARLIEAREDGRLSVVLRGEGDDLPWSEK